MTIFSLGWNSSWVSQAEISAQVLKEILLKWKWRLHGEGFCQGWKAEKPHVVTAKFQPGLKRELGQVKWWNIQLNKMEAMEKLCWKQGWNSPCNCNKISAWVMAEIHHVIAALFKHYISQTPWFLKVIFIYNKKKIHLSQVAHQARAFHRNKATRSNLTAPWMGCRFISGLQPALNLPVPIYTPEWKEKLKQ